MANNKKKSSAEATANPKRVKYIKLKAQMQDDCPVRDASDIRTDN